LRVRGELEARPVKLRDDDEGSGLRYLAARGVRVRNRDDLVAGSQEWKVTRCQATADAVEPTQRRSDGVEREHLQQQETRRGDVWNRGRAVVGRAGVRRLDAGA
jgi:hypothetical protein